MSTKNNHTNPATPQTDGGTHPNTRNTAGPPAKLRTISNIIVFGETGVGKSSLIKMLVGSFESEAEVSSDAAGRTTGTPNYSITIGNAGYRIWDTPGLNEGNEGTISTLDAILKIHDLVQRLSREGGVNLLIYCIRAARFRDVLRVNYDLIAKIVCDRKLPVVAVITGLEHEEDRDSWWIANRRHFERMAFQGHACVTTTKGKKEGRRYVFEKEYQESKKQVQHLIKQRTVTRNVPVTVKNAARIKREFREYMGAFNSKGRTEWDMEIEPDCGCIIM